jgi:hypothetical protein
MPTITLSWNAVSGASGYRIHAGPVSGLYTHVSANIAAPTVTGSVTVPTEGTWYVAVAAYDASGYEGVYSAEQTAVAGGSSPPVGTPVLSVR